MGEEMMISAGHSLAVIGVAAACTVILRAFPFLVFGGRKDVPETVRYLGTVLPAAIMAVLVVYCLRNIDFTEASHFIPSIAAGLLVAVLHVWKKNILLSISVGTVFYMIMVQI